MGSLRFKIARYNRGGYLGYLPDTTGQYLGTDLYGNSVPNLNGSPKSSMGGMGVAGKASLGLASLANSIPDNTDPNYLSTSTFAQKAADKQRAREKAVDAASTALQAVPVYGQFVGAGLQVGKGIGKVTKDKYGIYKSKAAEYADNAFDPVKGLENIENAFSHPTFSNLTNVFTSGLLGKSYANEQAKKEKQKYITQGLAEASTSMNRAGSLSRAAIGGYQAAPYGKKGMKLKTRTKYSRP